MPERGVIRNPNLSCRVNNFSGLCFGKITPTDLDGLIEIRDTVYIVIETKFDGATIPYGQKKAIERLVDLATESNRKAIGLICRHQNESGDIDVAKCPVSEFRWHREWHTPQKPITTRDACERFIGTDLLREVGALPL